LLAPTYDLLTLLDKTGGKVTFFIDALYLRRLQEAREHAETYAWIESQIKTMVEKGHRIELHLHPHWLDATWNTSKESWDFPSYEHYAIQTLPQDKIREIVYDCTELLNGIARTVQYDYQVKAYRAGGWCVDPFEKIATALLNAGIMVDSSVIPGFIMSGTTHHADYSDINPTAFYRFDHDLRDAVPNGQFIEIPVNCYKETVKNKLTNVLSRNIHRLSSRPYGDGLGLSIIARRTILGKLYSFLTRQANLQLYSLDGYVNFQSLRKNLDNSLLDFITIVAHPKSLTKSSLRAIELLGKKGYKLHSFEYIYDKRD